MHGNLEVGLKVTKNPVNHGAKSIQVSYVMSWVPQKTINRAPSQPSSVGPWGTIAAVNPARSSMLGGVSSMPSINAFQRSSEGRNRCPGCSWKAVKRPIQEALLSSMNWCVRGIQGFVQVAMLSYLLQLVICYTCLFCTIYCLLDDYWWRVCISRSHKVTKMIRSPLLSSPFVCSGAPNKWETW